MNPVEDDLKGELYEWLQFLGWFGLVSLLQPLAYEAHSVTGVSSGL